MSVRHDFKCPAGHIFEADVHWKAEFLPCRQDGCNETAHLVFLPRTFRNAQFAQPIVVFKNTKTGKFRFPGKADNPTPTGFERLEIRSVAEARKFEKHMNLKEKERYEQRKIMDEIEMAPVRDYMRAELRKKMEHFSPFGRAFAEAAIKETNERPRNYNFDPGFRIEVLD